MEDLTPDMEQFMREEGIQIFHYRTEGNKEPFQEISTEDINHALVKLLDERSHPGEHYHSKLFLKTPFATNADPLEILVLIHCLKGKVACSYFVL